MGVECPACEGTGVGRTGGLCGLPGLGWEGKGGPRPTLPRHHSLTAPEDGASPAHAWDLWFEMLVWVGARRCICCCWGLLTRLACWSQRHEPQSCNSRRGLPRVAVAGPRPLTAPQTESGCSPVPGGAPHFFNTSELPSVFRACTGLSCGLWLISMQPCRWSNRAPGLSRRASPAAESGFGVGVAAGSLTAAQSPDANAGA